MPHFHTNIVSSSRCRKNGFYLSEKDRAIVKNEGIAATLNEQYGLWIVESVTDPKIANALRTSANPRREVATDNLWHQTMSHISKTAIRQHLEDAAEDAEVVRARNQHDDTGIEKRCDICELAKSKVIVSRRQIRAGQQPFEVIHADLVDINPDAYNGDKWAFHAICDHTNFHFCMTSKHKDVLAKGIITINAFVRRYTKGKFAVAFIHVDQDTVLQSNVFHDFVIPEGIAVNESAPYARGQNGKIERENRTIVEMARSLRLQSRLSADL